ncbi:hypothetical protein F5Y08DRAFT_337367 [Xylaria arbuscula]|uniref:Uncharacterized protein n=1 Tax=Xylaria arbuscula TaxID=114810 RepID=A0A9W8NP32_9PEZI|nr:hypothetical protein F5Y08DRAFT_337367 [Xylaria arbuscula]KAJ3580236.1 hypothetical protein NPX13_g324 [Xylaria arbuscula]
MRTSILLALATSVLLVGARPTTPGGGHNHRYLILALFQDNDCKIPVPGDGTTTVMAATCDSNVKTGWMSAKILETADEPLGYNGPQFYHNNNCAMSQKHHGYSGRDMKVCMKDFGFVANAVGFW